MLVFLIVVVGGVITPIAYSLDHSDRLFAGVRARRTQARRSAPGCSKQNGRNSGCSGRAEAMAVPWI
jgi:hypothetical protein